jgi:hypothetical protein
MQAAARVSEYVPGTHERQLDESTAPASALYRPASQNSQPFSLTDPELDE